MKDSDFLSMLVQLSEAISKKGEKYVDLLRVLYRDLANVISDLAKANCAFDLFQLLNAPGILKPTDISVLFETIELTGLKFLEEIIKRYETYPDEVKITRFTPHRQQVVALGKDFSVKDLQKVCQLYEGNFSSPWKLIQHLEDTSVLTENSMSSFLQHLNENKVKECTDFNQLLDRISDAISKEGEKYVDMLRVLYRDLAEFKADLEEAKSAFDLFQILRVANVLKATDISVLFETIEVTGLRYLEEIVKVYETYPAEVKITRFSAHRRHLVDLGKDFSSRAIQKIGRVYKVPDGFCSNPWKLITFLESEGIVSEDKLSSFLTNLKGIGVGEVSTSKRPKSDKGSSQAASSSKQVAIQGMTDRHFKVLKMCVSKWHDKHKHLTMLKVLFRDHVDNATLSGITNTMDLLNELVKRGHLQVSNLDILYDTIIITKHFDLQRTIQEILPSFPDVTERSISKQFTPHRCKLMKCGTCLTLANVTDIDAWYNSPLNRYPDSWSMITDLENRMEIIDGDMKDFISSLEKLEIHHALNALH